MVPFYLLITIHLSDSKLLMNVLIKIVIVDCCLGNLRSVQNALQTLQVDVFISNQVKDLSNADAVVLPGVGAFREAIKNIGSLRSTIHENIERGKPFLGICLGLQLLFTESKEGGIYSGLDVLQGQIVRFPRQVKVPHIGWNTLRIIDDNNPLVEGLQAEEYVYFLHSYYAKIKDRTMIVALTEYDINFPSIVAKKNIFATQFHPEKSGKTGLKILQNFLRYVRK